MQPSSASQAPSPRQTPRRENTKVVLVVVAVVIIAAALVAAFLYLNMASWLIDGGQFKPTVTMAANCPTNTSADLEVADSYPSGSPDHYKLTLQVGSVFGAAQPAPTTSGTPARINVSGADYVVTWQNPGGSGNLSLGDHFLLRYPTGAGAPAAGTQMYFYLVWAADGAIITQVAFMVPSYLPGTKPSVVIHMTQGPGEVSLLLTCVLPTEPPADFKVNLQNATNQDVGTAAAMPTTDGGRVQVTVSGVVFTVAWHDNDGSGSVSPGDTFVVRYTAAVGTHWNFLLIWAADGSVLPTNTSWVV